MQIVVTSGTTNFTLVCLMLDLKLFLGIKITSDFLSPRFPLTVNMSGSSAACWLVDQDQNDLTPFPTEDRRYWNTSLDLATPSRSMVHLVLDQ